ncbi:E3 ubiquitin-protein ligase MARCH5 [Colletotrichum sidae]|uniref:E3 ubiquitin-protein ligase MARCH5 n=1 Tax=Colletotrichum sidae TaxID=1347389 RepID=A0A4R8T5P8_9PEZI|nr:E3 ubiquitin-protein ligase MARCH5 [Colletotrichum sidae]
MTDTVTTSPQDDALRRCFICLMDENESGSSDSAWVNPCPCSLSGHQDCMIAWVTDLERENKEIRCPVCKASIAVDEPFDPAVALSNQVYRLFSKISPGLILGGLGAGTWVGLAMYGNIAVRVFAGPEATYRFFFNERTARPNVNWIHVAILPTIAPALVIGQSFPLLGNFLMMPAAALYGVFHMARDDNFFSWPPSPQLAVAAFPFIQSAYNNIYFEFTSSYRERWERRIAGLPEPPPLADRQERQQQRRARDQNAGNEPRNGGIVGGLLDAAIDMLDIPDVDVEVELEVEARELGEGDVAVDMDIFIEELQEFEEGPDAAEGGQAILGFGDGAQGGEEQQANNQDVPAPQQQQEQEQPQQQPQPAAPRQRGLQASLRDVTNSLASTLLLPVISAGMGELIRLALPKHLTTPPTSGLSRFRLRTGLLQDQWGRNFVGGCMYVVLRDAFKLYTRYRMAQNKPMRKIRNVDRKRNTAST